MPLIAPCFCSGSLKYVHQECLQRWIKSADIKRCELCKYPFSMQSKVRRRGRGGGETNRSEEEEIIHNTTYTYLRNGMLRDLVKSLGSTVAVAVAVQYKLSSARDEWERIYRKKGCAVELFRMAIFFSLVVDIDNKGKKMLLLLSAAAAVVVITFADTQVIFLSFPNRFSVLYFEKLLI